MDLKASTTFSMSTTFILKLLHLLNVISHVRHKSHFQKVEIMIFFYLNFKRLVHCSKIEGTSSAGYAFSELQRWV